MSELQPSDVLWIPKRRRLTHSRFKAEDGQEILHLFYGEIELIFDEPDIAPLGEKLIEVERFRADEAMTWSNGSPHDWTRIRDLLQALLDQEVLKIYTESAKVAAEQYPQRLGLAPDDRPVQTFSAAGQGPSRCPVITQEAFGHAYDLENLELMVPVYRVAHPAMDTDGRQVGENNVTPRNLFLDLPAQRKLCQYAGSRFQDERPMNQTALKHMAKRWPELLSLSEQFRLALWKRMPPVEPDKMRAGELHYLAVCTLGAVGYLMVRGENPVPNGELDGGMAAMFRLIDGVRLVTNDLIREEPESRGCEQLVTSKSINDFAEHYSVYRGNLGVCAGPPALIDEYLQVMMGEMPAPINVEPDVASRLGDIDAAIDYGLLGSRVESIVRYVGGTLAVLHEKLRAVFASAPESRLRELLQVPIAPSALPLMRDDYPPDVTLQREIDVSCWLFDRAGDALAGKVEPGKLEERMRRDPAVAASAPRLSEFFATALPADKAIAEPLRSELAAAAVDAFALERRGLQLLEREQGSLNTRLRRAQSRPLTPADMAAFNNQRSGPALSATLAEGLGITVTSDANATVVSYGDHSLTLSE